MLDMGFFDDVTKILDRIKNRTNLGLFSATISQEVMTVSWMYQRDEVEITVAPTEESKPDIDQYSITVPRLEKEEAMLRILRSGALERVIVFCNTKVMCQRLSDDLRRAGIRADCLHGDIKQATREKTMADFRHGKLPVLIATDVASRGIDVDDVDGVINYDVPEENEYYIRPPHRPHGPRPEKGHLLHAARLVPGEGQAGRDRKICGLPHRSDDL